MRKQTAALALVLSVLAALAAAGARAAELEVPLTVRESGGAARMNECVTTGVPLLPGQCRDAKTLRLLDAEGNEVPAQFRELARWWNKDDSIRWVLVDFQSGMKPFGSRKLTLTDGRAAEYESALKVEETDEAVIVTTGPARFVINRKNFNLFDRVSIDANGDGEFADAEEIISPNPEHGSVVTDTFGQKYYSGQGTAQVTVEEAGPVRVCVAAKGLHKAPDGKGYSKGMYNFEIRMHFYAGKTMVRLDPVIAGSGPEHNGSPTFEDFSLVTRLNVDPAPNPNEEDPGKDRKRTLFQIYGLAPLTGEMFEGQSVSIYQDSNGAETWDVNSGLAVSNDQASELAGFRGYRITRKGGEEEEVLTRGDQARGVVNLIGNKCGLVVVPRYFWQLFPKAIEIGYDGSTRIGILPGEYQGVHWLADAGGAGQEMWLLFYARGMKDGKVTYPRDGQTRSKWRGLMRDRPWPHVVADSTNPPLFAVAPPEHNAACGALSDLGPYEPVTTGGGFPLAVWERRYMTTDYLKGNNFGWQVFGCRWEEFAGHSPWNYEPIGSSDFLYRFLNTGHPTWLEHGLRRHKHFRDVRAFKFDGVDVFGFTSWPDCRAKSVCEGYCKRTKPAGAEIEKYSAGRYGRKEWLLPNPAHMNLDDVLELYCFTGDTRSLEGMRNIAAVGGSRVAFETIKIHRVDGWCFRALMQYYNLTGDPAARPYVEKAQDNFWAMRKQYRGVSRIEYPQKLTWFYNITGRAVILAYLTTGDERMRDLAIGLTQNRNVKSQHPALNAFAWEQTGKEGYLSEQPDKFVKLGGYFPSCDARRWKTPRPDRSPPAAVADLAAEAGGDGTVKLTWTAPGDDGDEGTASVYQVKWSDAPIVEAADGGNQCSFWAADNVSDEPKPGAAGAEESFTVEGLTAGKLYFAVKVRDELNNESAISNVVAAEVK